MTRVSCWLLSRIVSIESGLEGRNNGDLRDLVSANACVSIESGLEGRNNVGFQVAQYQRHDSVSIESDLEGRNNRGQRLWAVPLVPGRLNRVRPRRPEQSPTRPRPGCCTAPRLNRVRPRRPEQCGARPL